MKLRPKQAWFLAYTAAFAALAGFVFWGTWSPDYSPVMPDSVIVYSTHWFSDWWRAWAVNGKFIPNDLKVFLGSPYFWQELGYVIPLYFSGLAVAYYLRGRGLSRLAGYGAGLLLAFSGYWCTLFSAGHYGWFCWMTYGLFPFGLIDRAIRRNKTKNWLMLGATLGWAAHWQPDLWLIFTELTAAYFIFSCIVEGKLPWKREFPWKGSLMALASLVVIGASGFRHAFVNDLAGRDKQIAEGQTVANAEKVDEAEKRWIFTTNWSLPPEETVEFFWSRINGDTSCPMTLSLGNRYHTGVKQYTGALGRPKDATAGNYRQHSLYVGLVTCLLALAGLVSLFADRGDRSRRVQLAFFVVAAFGCWLLSMGRNCEFVYRIFYAMPFGDSLRAPVKWHHLTEFCLAVTAGFGIDYLLRRFGSFKWTKYVIAAVVLAGAIDLAHIAHLYCAPVDVSISRRQGMNEQLTFLRREEMSRPEVAAMIKSQRIVAQAMVNPDVYLVSVVSPWGKPTDKPFPPLGLAAWLSILSMVGSVGLFAYAARHA